MKPKFSLETKFKPVGRSYICNVVDIWTTTNLAGETVDLVYIADYEFCGQKMTGKFIETTIARGLIA